MDTPGHVDFAYEVSRSLAACEGALLVVDAAQGVEAQTLANVYQSIEHDHEIVPVINKVDLPVRRPRGGPAGDRGDHRPRRVAARCSLSAKTGLGIEEVLDAIVARIPPPKGDARRAAEGDAGRQLVRPLSRRRHPRPRDRRRPCARASRSSSWPPAPPTWSTASAASRPKRTDLPELAAGEIGFITAQIKEVAETRVGDTITDAKKPTANAAARLQGSPAGGVLRPVPGRRQRLREAAREHVQAAPQRRRRSASRWRPARRLASASAAASSASSTSRSSRNG